MTKNRPPINTVEQQALTEALQLLPGIEVSSPGFQWPDGSICQFFEVSDFGARGFLLLSRLFSHNYYAFSGAGWLVKLAHQDVEPQVCFMIEGPAGDSAGCSALANAILDHVKDGVTGYNILLDQ